MRLPTSVESLVSEELSADCTCSSGTEMSVASQRSVQWQPSSAWKLTKSNSNLQELVRYEGPPGLTTRSKNATRSKGHRH